jgi:hypothetical protein
MFYNPIPVPSSARVDSTGRGTVKELGPGQWRVTTLDSGPQTITVTAGQVSEDVEIEVTGTFGGFFAAGGALYYVGAVLIGLIAVVLLVLLVMALRSGRGDDDWDDDYDEDEEDSTPTARGPSGPAPGKGPSGPCTWNWSEWACSWNWSKWPRTIESSARSRRERRYKLDG